MKTLLSIILIFLTLSLPGQTIPRDKQLHIGAGALVGAWGTMIPQNNTGWKPFLYGVSAATIAGVGKEIIDLGGFGTPDFKDLGATVLGGVVSAGIITGMKAVIKKTNLLKKKSYRYAIKYR